jgi:hypothetical protein
MDSIVYKLPKRSLNDGLNWIKRLPNSELVIKLALILMYSTLNFYEYEISKEIVDRIYAVLKDF